MRAELYAPLRATAEKSGSPVNFSRSLKLIAGRREEGGEKKAPRRSPPVGGGCARGYRSSARCSRRNGFTASPASFVPRARDEETEPRLTRRRTVNCAAFGASLRVLRLSRCPLRALRSATSATVFRREEEEEEEGWGGQEKSDTLAWDWVRVSQSSVCVCVSARRKHAAGSSPDRTVSPNNIWIVKYSHFLSALDQKVIAKHNARARLLEPHTARHRRCGCCCVFLLLSPFVCIVGVVKREQRASPGILRSEMCAHLAMRGASRQLFPPLIDKTHPAAFPASPLLHPSEKRHPDRQSPPVNLRL